MIPTCAVTGTFATPDDEPLVGAVVTARLTTVEVYDGLVVPKIVDGTTDSAGQVTMDLFPNELGTLGSTYIVRVEHPDVRDQEFIILVPDAASGDMHDMLADSDAQPVTAPVRSFNGRTGVITLTQADVTGAGGATAASVAAIAPPTGAQPLSIHPSAGIVGQDGSNTVVISGARALSGALVSYIRATNTGPNNGYGRRFGYVSNAYGSGFDLADAIIARFERASAAETGGQSMAQWIVAMSPRITDTACSTRTCIGELNVVNRGADTGPLKRRSDALQSTCFLQIVPEAQNFSGQADPGVPKNITAGFVFTNAPQSPETDALGYRPRMYAPLLGEPNSTHEDGMAIRWSGSDGTGGPGGGAPVAFAYLSDAWQSGYRTDDATFTIDPLVLGAGQGLRWLDGAGNTAGRMSCSASGIITRQGFGAGRVVEAVLTRAVSNPSGIALTSDGASATASNTIQVPASGAIRITGNALARSGTPLVSGWTINVLARRNSATDVTILASTITKDSSTDTTDWVLSAEADDTLGSVQFKITGTGSFTIYADLRCVTGV